MLKRFTIPQNLTEFWTETPEYVASYSAISNYKDNFLFVSISAIEELRKAVNITQLRFYCFKKEQGSVVHVMTKNSSAGVSVLDYFLVNCDRNPKFSEVIFKKHNLKVYANYVQCNLTRCY